MKTSDKWFFRRKENADAEYRLICFHHAGGNASWYLPWAELCGDNVELCAVELPMRSSRIDEELPENIEKLVECFIRECRGIFDKPVIIFGHSMGAFIAYETAYQLKTKYGITPKLLVVSGASAPVIPEIQITGRSAVSASDEELTEILNGYEQMDSELLSSPEFCSYFFPIVRKDFHLCEMYTRKPKIKLDCPIICMIGTEDDSVTEKDCQLWEKYTSAQFSLEKYSGGHFFPQNHTADIINLILDRR
ncbi:MAG: alpha/beta fold hydrolase [Ruminococcus flavefaciens]|nr:alpha/beta fold hydrolase [Ruminococcus flavefaciens]